MSTTTYTATFNIVHSDLDTWGEGCAAQGVTNFIETKIEATTINGLLAKIAKRYNVEVEHLLLNSCDEMGRIDVQTYTKTIGPVKCTYQHYKEEFQKGNISLYLNNISGTVESRTTDFDIVALKSLENLSK